MANWQRWLNYGKAKLDSTLRSGEEELDRREARLEAEAAEKPWLRGTAAAPTLDEVKARIAFDAEQAEAAAKKSPGDPPSTTPLPVDNSSALGGQAGFDFNEQQRQADERLATIRSELGLDDRPKSPEDPPPSDDPPGH